MGEVELQDILRILRLLHHWSAWARNFKCGSFSTCREAFSFSELCVMIRENGECVCTLIHAYGCRWFESLIVHIAFGLAFAFLIITTILTIIKLCTGDYNKPKFIPNVTDLSSFRKLFTIVPVLVNAFICNCNIHIIQNELEDVTQIKPVVQTALKMFVILFLVGDLAECQLQNTEKAELAIFNDGLFLEYVVDLVVVRDLDLQEKALEAIKTLLQLKSIEPQILRELCRLERALERMKLQLKESMSDEYKRDYAADVKSLRGEVELIFRRKLGIL